MNQRRLIIDVAKCHNCNNCFLACKDEHCGNTWPGYAAAQPLHGQRWINLLSRERGRFPHLDVAYLPKPCQHCADAPCIAAAENGAVYRRPDGIVIIDPQKARGQRQLLQACPYGAVWWNRELQLAQKCTLCAHLLDNGWAVPRCVQACPTEALKLVDWSLGQARRRIAEEKLEVLERESAAPAWGVYYKNLYRFTHDFIAGSVAGGKGALEECLAGISVVLFCGDTPIAATASDTFGDFRFDAVRPGDGPYHLEILPPAGPSIRIDVDLSRGGVVGTVWI